jgi:hypothetical protein
MAVGVHHGMAEPRAQVRGADAGHAADPSAERSTAPASLW